ncbi:MAG: class B sortase [Clostridiales bacterium]|nr:class B sortase [Clostridiales bacterium]
MSRQLLRLLNGLVSTVIVLALIVSGVYAGYALWDNEQIYASAENVQADMIQLKPKVVETADAEEEAGPSFAELLAINPDVCGWVTMDNTRIDHPVLQGESNFSYINTDVYGDFALAGSIFLDYRCNKAFTDYYSLTYGHHMVNGGMYGDLELYKDKTFFEENRTGTLITPDRVYLLETFACLVVISSEDNIFYPQKWQDEIDGLIDFAKLNAMHLHNDTIDAMLEEELETGVIPQVLALTTCSSEFTDARTIILAVMKEYTPAK